MAGTLQATEGLTSQICEVLEDPRLLGVRVVVVPSSEQQACPLNSGIRGTRKFDSTQIRPNASADCNKPAGRPVGRAGLEPATDGL